MQALYRKAFRQSRGRQMTTHRHPVHSLALVVLVAMAFVAEAQAQSYPNRPVTFVVPFAPGGLTDVPARVLAAEMQERIRAPIVVENKPGASGVTGATSVWRAEPDGYTLLVNALADVQNLHYIPVPYNAVTDFALIGQITDGPPLVLVVNAGLPYKSVAELVADAKANPSKISFGTSGPASSPIIAVTQLNALAGTRIVDVPYRGSGQAAVAVATGEIQGAFVFYSNAKPLSDDGKVRALAVSSPQRLAGWPDIPTMDELGFPGFDHRGFVGLAAPGKTPAPIIAFLNRHLNDAINSDAFRRRMEPLGMTIPTDNTPERFADFMRREMARQAELARLSGHSPSEPKR
jgi:tripartite-type tricarboxylate transporter receptor subunit TctC